MGKRGTLVLLALVVGLLTYVMVFERDSLTSGELEARRGRALPTFVRDRLDRLEVQRRGVSVVLTRSHLPDSGDFGSWQLSAPEQGEAEADADAVDLLLGELEWLDARRTLTDVAAEDLDRFGLAKPRYRVRYHAGQTTETLLVGHDDPRGEGVYAQLAGAKTKVMVVPKTLVEALDHDPGHYRDKDLLPDVVVAWTTKLELIAGGATQLVVKRDGRFVIDGSPALFADSRAIEALLRELDGLRAARYLEGEAREQSRAALGAPQRMLRVSVVPDISREDRQATMVELRIAGACPGHGGETLVAAGPDGPPACVRDADLEPLVVTPESLRLLSLIDGHTSDIERIALEGGITLERDGEGWKRADAEGETGTPDAAAVEGWLRALSDAKALDFRPSEALDHAHTVRFRRADGQERTLSVGAADAAGQVPVQRDDEAVLALYPRQLADLLAPLPGRFEPLELWSRQPSELVAFTAQAGAHSRALTLSDGVFRPAKGAEPAADEGRVREALRDLIKLQALVRVSDEARPEHGLEQPSARLTMTLKDGARLSLAIGGPSARGRFAQTEQGMVVEVGAEAERWVLQLAGGKVQVPPPTPALDGHDHDDGGDHDHDDSEDHDDSHDHDHGLEEGGEAR